MMNKHTYFPPDYKESNKEMHKYAVYYIFAQTIH